MICNRQCGRIANLSFLCKGLFQKILHMENIKSAIIELLKIVKRLKNNYPYKEFTLDGRLVGDIGEVLAEQIYDIKLFDKITHHYDGISSDGRKVQIKATMKRALNFPADHVPDYYLGIKILENGDFEEIYNGPGAIIWDALKNRKRPKTNLHSVGIGRLRKLGSIIDIKDRIKIKNSSLSEK